MTKDSPPSNTSSSSLEGDISARWINPSSVQRIFTRLPHLPRSEPAGHSASVQCTARRPEKIARLRRGSAPSFRRSPPVGARFRRLRPRAAQILLQKQFRGGVELEAGFLLHETVALVGKHQVFPPFAGPAP